MVLGLAALIIKVGGSSKPAPPIMDDMTPPTSHPALIIGLPEAKLTVRVYGDFQCSKCSRFYASVLADVRRDYAGQVKIDWVNDPSLGPESLQAAQATRCANDQGFFPQFFDATLIYMNNNFWSRGLTGRNIGALDASHLKRLAASSYELINQPQFDKCLDSGQYKGIVGDEVNDAARAGFGLTIFEIGGQAVQGLQPYSVVKPAIEAQL